MAVWLEKTNSIKEKSCGVYKIYNTINDKVYIGISTNLKYRLKTHYHKLCKKVHHNEYLQNSVNLHGIESFDFEILELLSSNIGDCDLLKKEFEYQQLYKSCDELHGYNIQTTDINGVIRHTEEFKERTRKRMTGRIVTKETRQLLSDAFKGKKGTPHTEEFKERTRKRMTGRVVSPETIEKMSKAKLGKPSPLRGKPGFIPTAETRQKMSARRTGSLNCRAVKIIDDSGNIYLTIKETCEKLDICRSTVVNYLKSGKFKRI